MRDAEARVVVFIVELRCRGAMVVCVKDGLADASDSSKFEVHWDRSNQHQSRVSVTRSVDVSRVA